MWLYVSTTESDLCKQYKFNVFFVLQSQTQSNVSTAKDVLSKIGKPRQRGQITIEAPSFSKFDPQSEQICSQIVEMVMLKNFQTCIPKGECRQLLEAVRSKMFS